MTRIAYVPTHRPEAAAIRPVVQECAVLRGLTGQDHLAVVVEHTAAPWVEAHRDALLEAAQQERTPTLHLTVERWRGILDVILAEHAADRSDTDRLRRLLQPTGIAYSAGPNKAFLIAAAIGVDVLHRRDSDHVPDQRQEGFAFPGALEAPVIGRTPREISPLTNLDALPADRWDSPVLFVGSGMFGDPPHDRRDLLQTGEELVVNVERLSSPGSSLDKLRGEVRDYFIVEPSTRYDSDFFEIDITGRTELGVSCLKQVFLHLPEAPIRDTLGCDYFQKNLLYQLGRPVLFHSRKMRHVYDPARAAAANVASVVDYALRDLRYLILWRVWSAHNQTIRADRCRFLHPDGSLRGDRYAGSLTEAAAAVLPTVAGVPDQYSRIYAEAAERASGARAERLRAVAAAARRLGDGAVKDVARGVDDFVFLIDRWPALVRATAAAGPIVRGHIVPPPGDLRPS